MLSWASARECNGCRHASFARGHSAWLDAHGSPGARCDDRQWLRRTPGRSGALPGASVAVHARPVEPHVSVGALISCQWHRLDLAYARPGLAGYQLVSRDGGPTRFLL